MNHLDTTDFLDNVRRSTRTIAGMARVAITLTTGRIFQVSPLGDIECTPSLNSLTYTSATAAEARQLRAGIAAGTANVVVAPLARSGHSAAPASKIISLLTSTGAPTPYTHDETGVMAAVFALRRL